ncbi:MAG: hypothetical protein WBB28_09400 [Crinalium sp.]
MLTANHPDLIKITDHLNNLTLSQLRCLCTERLEKQELASVLASKLTMEEASAIAPSITVIKQRVYQALGVNDTKGVKAIAFDKGWISEKDDFRKKSTWLKIQQQLSNIEPTVSKSEFDDLTVRQLRAKAAEFKLPGWGKIIKEQGAEGLRNVLKQYSA